MADLKDIINNIENIYGSNNSLNMLKDFERVLDELGIYVFDNWFDGELAAGPKEHRYYVECMFMWPEKKMPEPRAGKILEDYGCKVKVGQSVLNRVRKIKTPDDIRPGTRKGKIDKENIWLVKIVMPKKLMYDIQKGYENLDQNKIEDILNQTATKAVNVDQPAEEAAPNVQPAQ